MNLSLRAHSELLNSPASLILWMLIKWKLILCLQFYLFIFWFLNIFSKFWISFILQELEIVCVQLRLGLGSHKFYSNRIVVLLDGCLYVRYFYLFFHSSQWVSHTKTKCGIKITHKLATLFSFLRLNCLQCQQINDMIDDAETMERLEIPFFSLRLIFKFHSWRMPKVSCMEFSVKVWMRIFSQVFESRMSMRDKFLHTLNSMSPELEMKSKNPAIFIESDQHQLERLTTAISNYRTRAKNFECNFVVC